MRNPGLAVLVIAMGGVVFPAPAAACGGFFCNSAGPTSQAGEDVVFAREDDGTLTAYIRIFYSGPADRFSWILPLPTVPTGIDVGPDELFTALDQATSPMFAADARTEGTCAIAPRCPHPPPRSGGPSGFADAGAAASDASGSGPMIYLREEVGPYDAVVLGGSADDVITWLGANGYDVMPGAEPLLRSYADAGHVFVAIRLLSDRSTGEIRPLVLHYAEGNPCVPLRLTAIATIPDMPIRIWFLGDVRAVPTNYSLLEPDFGVAGLWTGEMRYSDYISRLTDEAGGQAFVTDYAGSTPALAIERGTSEGLESVEDPSDLLRQLSYRGFRSDPRLVPLLRRFVPAPEGSDEVTFWNCLFFGTPAGCGWDGSFDAAGFAAAFDDEVLRPLREAQALVSGNPHTTRLFTTMSAEDMTIDPTFRYDSGVPQEVDRFHRATYVTECSADYYEGQAPMRLDLPNGSSARVSAGWRYDSAQSYCDAIAPGWRDSGFDPGEGGSPPVMRGGTCAVSHGTSAAALAVLALAAAALIARRRRERR